MNFSILSQTNQAMLIHEDNLSECLDLLKNYRPIFDQLNQISEQSNESQSLIYQSIDLKSGKLDQTFSSPESRKNINKI